MDFFEAFPHLRQEQDPALKGRALRLIGLSGIAYDDAAYYFEVTQQRYWTQVPGGKLAIGVGGIQAKLSSSQQLLKTLFRQVRDVWLTEPQRVPGGGTTLLEGERCTLLSGEYDAEVAMPHLLLLTTPQLGGGEVPDALVQVVYRVKLRKPPYPGQVPGIVRISREALGTFLSQEQWPLADLAKESWVEVLATELLPDAAYLRPVLALRGLQRLWQKGWLSEEGICLPTG